MVVFHVKAGDSDGFLYEASCDTKNDDLITNMVEIWNLRIRLRQLAGTIYDYYHYIAHFLCDYMPCLGSIRELGVHGPMKSPDKVSIDSIDEQYQGKVIDKGPFYNPDPSGIRTGNTITMSVYSYCDSIVIYKYSMV